MSTSDKDTGSMEKSGPLSSPPHTLEGNDVVAAYNVDPKLGLSEDKVKELQQKYGPNRLKPPPRPSLLKIFLRNVANAMTIVLIAATAVSFGTRDWISGGVIFALVIINVSVGTANEWSAEKTVAALESVGSPVATVIRHRAGASGEGEIAQKPTEEVVPGDIILIKIGDVVPADGRIIPGYCSSLEVDEALLTGESLPSVKQEESISDPDCPVGDRVNMVYSGAQVSKGRARAVVTAIGMQTELGKIAEAMDREEKRKETGLAYYWYRTKCALGVAGTTRLQIKLNGLAYILLGIACILAVVVVASTAFDNVPLTIATYAVATAVSLLPASLIAVVALSLANASKDLADRNALVRRMDAIETLAAVTDVCSDKTGTITVGKMVLKNVWVPALDADPRDGFERAPLNTENGQHYSVESGSDPYYPRGAVMPISSFSADTPPDEDDDDENNDFNEETSVHPHHMERRLRDLVLCGSLCNTATIHKNHETNSWQANGDATEVALTVFVHKLGHGRPHLTRDLNKIAEGRHQDQLHKTRTNQSTTSEKQHYVPKAPTDGSYEQLVEHPFDSGIKKMTTAYRFNPAEGAKEEAHCVVFLKGAIERVVDSCNYIGLDAKTELTPQYIEQIQARADELASKGLRVLTLCGKRLPIEQADHIKSAPREETEKDGFGFLGLVGIYDPPRPESKNAVADCHRAAIIPRMLTGDHKATATAIAQLVGIIGYSYAKTSVMTGPEFDKLSDDEVDQLEELPRVIARCAPETKVRMVEALHRRNRLAVMTGDGVNDAPSLKRADVGFAMGMNGSDVAKQSAEVVLADDNFSTIIRAIRKGRSVFSNLSKFLLYLLSCNVGQVLLLVLGLTFQDPAGESTFPLSPVAALWINTLSAGPPALALGLEPTDKNAMDKRPEDFKSIFVKWWWLDLFYYGLVMAAISIANFAIVAYAYHTAPLGVDCNAGYKAECEVVFRARAACFAVFLLVLMIHALTCKKPTISLFKTNLLDNKLLLWTVALLSVSVFPVIYIPVINRDVFYVSPIGWEWGMVFASLLVYLIFAELWKLLRSRQESKELQVKSEEDEKHDKALRMQDTVQPPRHYV